MPEINDKKQDGGACATLRRLGGAWGFPRLSRESQALAGATGSLRLVAVGLPSRLSAVDSGSAGI